MKAAAPKLFKRFLYNSEEKHTSTVIFDMHFGLCKYSFK